MKLSSFVATVILGHIRHSVCCGSRSLRHAMTLALVVMTSSAPSQTRLTLNSGNTLTTLSGSGSDGKTTVGDALTTRMGTPRTVRYDAAGNLFVQDWNYLGRLTKLRHVPGDASPAR